VPLPLAISLGDPWGIGPEVTAAALLEWEGSAADLVIAGARESFSSLLQRFPDFERFSSSFHSVFDGAIGGAPGKPPPEGGRLVLDTLKASVAFLLQARARALVTAPVNKALIHEIKPDFIGHTEFLGSHFGVTEPTMTFVCPGLVTALATTHTALKDIAPLITRERVLLHIRRLADWLRVRGTANRLAVCGLNPHAGEGGAFGTEESDAIAPAIRLAQQEGIAADGPWPADSIFRDALSGNYAGVLAMYHDQALVLFKAIDNGEGVNLTLGLPYIRTSPDHGTAYNLAGSGRASHSSMLAALRLAAFA
jgi:4-hydroxythreonine-4-phosphate dehydrogenase